MMLEADVVMGRLKSDPDTIPSYPIMAHPPYNTSDLSLNEFLSRVHNFNSQPRNNSAKGIKLDFKSIEVVGPSVESLLTVDSNWPVPVWLNADIIQGPKDDTKTPVNPEKFFDSCKNYPKATLSIGWTTQWGPDYRQGNYTADQVEEMKRAIRFNNVDASSSPITFPVRAGIAAQSKSQLVNLMTTFNATNEVTLTIWSSEGDYVNVTDLRDLIFSVGLNKVYVDVPDDLSKQLRLDHPPNKSCTICPPLLMFILSLFMSLGMIINNK